MSRKRFLYDLIHSLNNTELRFCKKYIQAFEAKSSDFILLLEAILKQKSFDEKTLKTALKKHSFIKHFPVYKNLLFNSILKALRIYYQEEIDIDKLFILEKNYRILKNRGLPAIANIQLDKAIHLSDEVEALINKIRLGQWQNNRLSNLEIYRDDKAANNNFVDIPALCDQLKYYYVFESLAKKIDKIILKSSMRKAEDIEQLNTLLHSEPLTINVNLLSVRTRVFYYHSRASCFLGLKQYTAFTEANMALYDLFDEYPKILDTEPFAKIITYRNLIWGLLRTREQLEDIDPYIEKYKKFIDSFKGKKRSAIQYERRMLDCTFGFQLNFYLYRKEYRSAFEYAKKLNEAVNKKADKLSLYHTINYKYEIAYTFWCNGLLKEAQQALMVLLNEENLNIRNDVFAFTHLLNALIEYEHKNFELLGYQLTNLKLKLKRRDYFYSFEKAIIEMLSKLVKQPNKKNAIKIFEQYEKIFSDLNKFDTETEAFERLNIMWWIRKQLKS